MEHFRVNKKIIGWGIFILILIGIIFFYFTLSKKGLRVLIRVNPCYLFILFVLWFLYILFDSVKFSILSHIGENRISVKTAFETIVIGIFLAAITPFQMSGLPVQIYYLYRKNINVGEATSYILLRGMVTFTGILTLALPYSYIFRNTFQGIMRGIYLYAIFVISMISLVYLLVIFAPNILKKIIKGKSFEEFMILRLVLLNALEKRGKRRYLLYAFLSTLLSLAFLGLIPYMVQIAIGIRKFTLFESIGYQMIVVSSLLFSPTPGGSGIAETAGSFIFLGNLSSVYVFPFIVLWRFFTFYLSAIIGGLIFIREGKKLLK